MMPHAQHDNGFGMAGIANDIVAPNDVTHRLGVRRTAHWNAHSGKQDKIVQALQKLLRNALRRMWVVLCDKVPEPFEISY